MLCFFQRVVDKQGVVDDEFADSVAMELKTLRASREVCFSATLCPSNSPSVSLSLNQDCSFPDLVSAVMGIALADVTSKTDFLARIEQFSTVLKHFNPFKEGSEDVGVMVGNFFVRAT